MSFFLKFLVVPPLANWNRRLTQHVAPWQVFVVSFLFACLVFIFPVVRRGEWNAPPLPGDGPDYDAIAVSLSAGDGFSLAGSSPEYLAPYHAAPEPETYAYLDGRPSEPSLTAYRPPLLPLLMAGTYQAFGRQFGPIRGINCALMAAAGAIGALLAFRWGGAFPAVLLMVLFTLFDERPREHARDILTESLATFLVMLLLWQFIALAEKRRPGQWFGIGITTGAAVLARSAFVMWLPGFVLLIFFLSAPRMSPWLSVVRVKAVLLYLLGFALVGGPWFVRNCLVLSAFMPTGTQGLIALGSAYSDEIFVHHGNWYPLPPEFFAPLKLDGNLSEIEREKQRALFSQSQAREWIKGNTNRLPELVAMKVNRFWRAKNRFEMLILICGSLGLLLTLRRHDGLISAAFLLLCTAQVAATYEAFGRFQVPVCPLLNALAALGLWVILLSATSYRAETERWLAEAQTAELPS